MKTVSVIIPVYNTQEYLRDCLESVVNQTLDSIEIIIIDDGSTDGSPDIISEYKEKYRDKIKVITKENGGQATARNIGIREATGEYISFVDSDDKIELEMYEVMYDKAVAENLDYVECGYHYLKVENNEIVSLPNYGDVKEHGNKRDMYVNPLVSPWNKLYRASVIKDNKVTFPEGYIYEDTSFFVKALAYINRFGYVDKEYVHHFLRSNSTMSINKSRKVSDIFPVLEDAINYYIDEGLYDEYRSELEYVCVSILLCSSLGRIAKVKDKKLQKEQIGMTRDMIVKYFEHYKKNPYFAGGMKNLYMKCITKHNIGFVCKLMSLK